MDKKMLSSYLDSIGELILEQNKIVTYKFLSKNLGVHVNTAKQLLYTFLTQQKNEHNSLSATYLLAGKLKGSGKAITIVNETEKLKEASKFSSITSDHVYSVQKSADLNDINVLCDITRGKSPLKKQYVIQCSKSFSKLNDNKKRKVETSDSKNLQGIHFESTTVTVHETTQTNQKSKNSDTHTTQKKGSPSKQLKEEKNSNKFAKGKNNIAFLFANASKKSVEQSSKTVTSKTVSPVKKNILKAEENEIEEKCTEIEPLGKIIKKEKKRKEGVKRKRIHIITYSDSSSDSCHEDEATEELQLDGSSFEKVLKMQDANDTKQEDQKLEDNVLHKNKKRKIVDVTVMNEDGYLETRKEVTFATDSEEETPHTEPPQKMKTQQNEQTKAESKKQSAGPKKQSSLLNFFKKS